MKTLVSSLLILAVVAIGASATQAATLTYTEATGTAVITPSPGGLIFGYNLTSDAKFFVDPARQPVLGPAAFFTNTPSEIGDNDVTFAGKDITIPLAILFPLADKPANLAALQAKFTGAVYVPALGQTNNLDFAFIPIPEPATAGLAGLCLVGLAAFRRRMA